ncbi:hypothetical protein E4U41_001510 [Claviceps citrina]|nr:hypothetical protein E4U41_001510 [Claviceps citrina]
MASLVRSAKGDKYIEKFYQSGRAELCPPDNSAHISAHNAVHSSEADDRMTVLGHMRLRQEMKMDQNYKKACRRAEKKGRSLPPREEYYTHWGYAYFMYSPAMYPTYLSPGMYYGWDPCYTHSGC